MLQTLSHHHVLSIELSLLIEAWKEDLVMLNFLCRLRALVEPSYDVDVVEIVQPKPFGQGRLPGQVSEAFSGSVEAGFEDGRLCRGVDSTALVLLMLTPSGGAVVPLTSKVKTVSSNEQMESFESCLMFPGLALTSV